VTNAEYGNLPGITATAIKAGRLSMAHMRHQMLRERDDSDATPALRFGKLAHMALLEPMKFAQSIAVWDGGRRQGSLWASWATENMGKEQVSSDELATFTAMQAALRADTDARFALSRASEFERVIQWSDQTHGACKARLDGAGDRVLVEFKTCKSIGKRGFLNQAESLGYTLQLAWYWHGAGRPENVWLVAQESAPPYCCVTYNAAASVLEQAYQECAEIAARYRACEACGQFPGPHPGVQAWERPAWTACDEVNMEGATEI
jgi:hypothetical protein